MYSIRGYSQMVSDRLRTQAYARALEHAIRPGSTVLDIGTGTGILALLACRFGAGKVFAVEPSESIEVAKELAHANGFGNRIEFFRAMSTAIDLPHRVDVVACDLHGILPHFQHSLPAIIDARNRHLRPSGILIPAGDVLRAAPVEATMQFAELTAEWQCDAYGFDLEAANRLIMNSFHRAKCTADDLLAAPATVGTLDYSTVEDPTFTGSATFTAQRDAVAHGWAVWFDCRLAEGVEISNAPGMPPLIYGQAFFPWPKPVALRAGDRLSLRLRAHLVGENYLWEWTSEAGSGSFRQSEFESQVLSPGTLRSRAASHVPAPGPNARIDLRTLELIGQAKTLGEIATALHAEFPKRFARWEDALTHASGVSRLYEG